jgi:hypothetical protein
MNSVTLRDWATSTRLKTDVTVCFVVATKEIVGFTMTIDKDEPWSIWTLGLGDKLGMLKPYGRRTSAQGPAKLGVTSLRE